MSKQQVLIVSCVFPNKKILFNETEDVFILPCEETEQIVESLRWGISIMMNEQFLNSYEKALSQFDEYREEFVRLVEGGLQYVEFEDLRFSLRKLPFEPGVENAKDLSQIKSGNLLFIRYDKDDNELGVFAEDDGKQTARFVNFFRTSNPQTLTLYHFMPFVIDGEVGYMINHKHERVSAPLKYAKALEGFFYFVVDNDDNGYIVDLMGCKVTESPTRIDFDNPGYNGYIIFMEGDKYGFIHAKSGQKSPVIYEDIDVVEIEEPVRVKRDGEWGYLSENFDFISEKALEQDEEDILSDEIYWYGE